MTACRLPQTLLSHMLRPAWALPRPPLRWPFPLRCPCPDRLMRAFCLGFLAAAQHACHMIKAAKSPRLVTSKLVRPSLDTTPRRPNQRWDQCRGHQMELQFRSRALLSPMSMHACRVQT